MSDLYFIKKTTLDNIGDAIRDVKGTTDGIGMSTVADEIRTLSTITGDIFSRDITSITSEELRSVEKIGESAFCKYEALLSIDIPHTVKKIEKNAFADCTNLTSITVPFVGENYKGNRNTHFGHIFGAETYNDNNTYVPSSLKTVNITGGRIDEYAFYGCENITTINIGDDVTYIGDNAFSGCNLRCYIKDDLLYLGNEINNYVCLIGVNNATMSDANIAEGCKIIYGGVFNSCKATLRKVTIPDTVIYVSDTAFSDLNLTYDTNLDGIRYLGNENNQYIYCVGAEDKTITSCTIADGCKIIGRNAFYDCKSLSSVILPDGLLGINYGAFYQCNLSSVNMPDTIRYIGEWAFYNTELQTLTLPSNLEMIGKGAFIYCSFDSLVIPDSVSKIGEKTFANNDKLTSLIVGKGLNSIPHYTFANNTKLTSVTLPINIRYIGTYAFQNCSSIVNLTLPGRLDAIGGNAFEGCTSLKTITTRCIIPPSLGNNVFYNCKALTSVNVPDDVVNYYRVNWLQVILKIRGFVVTEITEEDLYDIIDIPADAFADRTSIKKITIPDTVKKIGLGAFRGCSSLEEISLPFIGESENKNTYLGHIFGANFFRQNSYCVPSSLKKVVVRNDIKDYAFYECRSLENIIIEEGVTRIGASSFYDCDSLRTIIIPKTVKTIKPLAFDDCNYLTIYCEVSKKPATWDDQWNTQNRPVVWDYHNNDVADDGYIYCDIDNVIYGIKDDEAYIMRQSPIVTNVNMQNTITYKSVQYNVVEILPEAFYECASLVEIRMSDNLRKIGANAFTGCVNLTQISLSNSITTIEEGAFEDCTSLKTIVIPAGVTSIGSYTFFGCTSLMLILCEVASKPDGYEQDWNFAYYDQTHGDVYHHVYFGYTGETIDADINVDGLLYGILNNTAYLRMQNTDLVTANIPRQIEFLGKSFTVTTIGEYAFSGCTKLNSIYIPETITSMETDCFNECTSLRKVYYECDNDPVSKWVNITHASLRATPLRYGAKLYFGNELVTDVEINTVTIKGLAFGFYDTLKSVHFKENVRYINQLAFYQCDALKSVTVGNVKNNCIYSYEDAFDQVRLEKYEVIDNATTIMYPCIIANGETMMSQYFTQLFIDTMKAPAEQFEFMKFIDDAIITSGDTIKKISNLVKKITIPNTIRKIENDAFYTSATFHEIEQVNFLGTADEWGTIEFGNEYSSPFVKGKNTTLYLDNEFAEDIVYNETMISPYAFRKYTRLKKLTFNNIQSIPDEAFINCSALETVWFSSERAPSVLTNIGSKAFYNCYKLKYVIIPDSVETIGSNAFATITTDMTKRELNIFCAGVQKPVGWADDWYVSGHNLSISVYWQATLIVENDLLFYTTSSNRATLFKSPEQIGAFVVPSEISYRDEGTPRTAIVDAIDENVFKDNKSLTSIDLSNVTKIGKETFSGCSMLETIEFKEGRYPLEFDDKAFYGCDILRNINVASLNSFLFAEGIRNLMHYGDYKSLYLNGEPVEEIIVGDGLERTIGTGALYKVDNIRNLNLYNITVEDRAVEDCRDLVSVICDKCEFGYELFYKCDNLKNVKLTNMIDNGRYTFEECNFDYFEVEGSYFRDSSRQFFTTDTLVINKAEDANYISTPTGVRHLILSGTDLTCQFGSISETLETVDINMKTLGWAVFAGTTSLHTVVLREGLEKIGSQAFGECPALKNITIPSTVNNLAPMAFALSELEQIVFKCIEPPVDSVPSGIKQYTTRIYVPDESFDTYKTLWETDRYAFDLRKLSTL